MAVRVGDERTLKLWHWDGDDIELRDGDGNTVARLSKNDDVEVFGFAVHAWGKVRRG